MRRVFRPTQLAQFLRGVGEVSAKQKRWPPSREQAELSPKPKPNKWKEGWGLVSHNTRGEEAMIYSEAEARIPHIKRQAGEQGLAAYVRGDTVAWECSLSSISPSERIGSLCMRGVPEVTAEDAAGSTSL